ncbi:MAG: hypothetical protein ACRD1T_12560, partial [Acidimicrobiia bacterium]
DYTPPPGSVITDTWRPVVDVSTASSLSSFNLVISAQSPIPEPLGQGSSASKNYPAGATSSDRLTLVWNTRTLTRYNGVYRLVATASSHGGNTESSTIPDIKVENPPVQPVNVTSRVEGEVPVISWSANPEPDLMHYRVYRSADAGSFSSIWTTTDTKLSDPNASKTASLRYQIDAVRRSPVKSSGIASIFSKPTAGLVVAPPGAATKPSVIDHSNPAPVAAVKPKTVMAKQGNLGFAPVLPYESLELPNAPEATSGGQEETSVEQTPVSQSIPQIVRSTVYKPPFIAAALLLLVTAMHVLRLAGRLLAARPSSATPAPILESST